MPQLASSVWRLRHAAPAPEPQITSPAPQMQLPPEQVEPVGQRKPHEPQLRSSLLKLASQPLLRLVSQSPRPEMQVHTADAHPSVVAGRPTHVEPHAPQWAGVDCRS